MAMLSRQELLAQVESIAGRPLTPDEKNKAAHSYFSKMHANAPKAPPPKVQPRSLPDRATEFFKGLTPSGLGERAEQFKADLSQPHSLGPFGETPAALGREARGLMNVAQGAVTWPYQAGKQVLGAMDAVEGTGQSADLARAAHGMKALGKVAYDATLGDVVDSPISMYMREKVGLAPEGSAKQMVDQYGYAGSALASVAPFLIAGKAAQYGIGAAMGKIKPDIDPTMNVPKHDPTIGDVILGDDGALPEVPLREAIEPFPEPVRLGPEPPPDLAPVQIGPQTAQGPLPVGDRVMGAVGKAAAPTVGKLQKIMEGKKPPELMLRPARAVVSGAEKGANIIGEGLKLVAGAGRQAAKELVLSRGDTSALTEMMTQDLNYRVRGAKYGVSRNLAIELKGLDKYFNDPKTEANFKKAVYREGTRAERDAIVAEMPDPLKRLYHKYRVLSEDLHGKVATDFYGDFYAPRIRVGGPKPTNKKAYEMSKASGIYSEDMNNAWKGSNDVPKALVVDVTGAKRPVYFNRGDNAAMDTFSDWLQNKDAIPEDMTQWPQWKDPNGNLGPFGISGKDSTKLALEEARSWKPPDAQHTYDSRLADLENYKEKVTPGTVVRERQIDPLAEKRIKYLEDPKMITLERALRVEVPLAVRSWLKDWESKGFIVSKKQAKVTEPPASGLWDKPEAREWAQIPNKDVFGEYAGKYMPKEVLDIMMGDDYYQSANGPQRLADSVSGMIRKNMISRNPATFISNLSSSLTYFAEVGGIGMHQLPNRIARAGHAMATNSKKFKLFIERGGFQTWHDQIKQTMRKDSDLTGKTVNDLAHYLADVLKKGDEFVDKRFPIHKASEAIDILTKYMYYDNKMTKLVGERWDRVATPFDVNYRAMEEAMLLGIDSSHVSNLTKWRRRYMHWVPAFTPKVMELHLKRPAETARANLKLASIHSALTYYGAVKTMEEMGWTPEEYMKFHLQSAQFNAAPFMFSWGAQIGKDGTKKPLTIDYGRHTIFSVAGPDLARTMMKDYYPGQSNYLPALFNQPALSRMAQAAQGEDWVTGEQLYSGVSSNWNKAKIGANFVARGALPFTQMERFAATLRGEGVSDVYEQTPVQSAIETFIGIKPRTMDTMRMQEKLAKRGEWQEGKIDQNIETFKRKKFENKLIRPEERIRHEDAAELGLGLDPDTLKPTGKDGWVQRYYGGMILPPEVGGAPVEASPVEDAIAVVERKIGRRLTADQRERYIARWNELHPR